MAILFGGVPAVAKQWRKLLAEMLPTMEFRVWPEVGDPNDIEFVLWRHPKQGVLATLPNVKALFTMAAGVDHLDYDDIPAGFPIVRVVDPGMQENISTYAITWTLYFHRHFHAYEEQKARREWKVLPTAIPEKTPVGILGLGTLGTITARCLTTMGFPVAGWSRTAKSLDGIECFHGPDGVLPLMGRSKIVIVLLPMTAETKGVINAASLAAMPEGGFLINVARGAMVVDDDLLAALDNGHLAGAALDVFNEEPLTSDHPFWTHSKIRMTPHNASGPNVPARARQLADDILRIQRGEAPSQPVNRHARY
jgi:glyoxylate/hydroxypyruvate reductase A